MKIYKLSAALVAGALMLGVTGVSANAASPITDAFIANAMPNIDFLDRSSRFALTHSKNARLRDFARSEAREQTLAANDIDGWIDASRAPTAGEPTVSAPAVVASAEGGELLTGRSVAVDGQRGQVVDNRLPMGQEDLDKLDGFEASEFDALYKEKQREALHQVETDYREYLVKGDDPALIALAKRELPKIKRRIQSLSGI